MITGVRKLLVWATATAAIASAVMLALSDGGVPRLDASRRPGSASTAPVTPAR